MKNRFLLSLMAFIFFCYKSDSKIHVDNFSRFSSNQLFSRYEMTENPNVEKLIAQHRDGNFDVVISNIKGDLNKDGVDDMVTVKQDTVNETRPYRLEIYLTQNDKKVKLFLLSDSAIVAKYPNGNNGFAMTTLFTGIIIKKGTLTINHELTRGSFAHQFRFQNGKFELIGYRSAGVSGRDVEEVDFNLSTGNKVVRRIPIGGNQVISTKKSKKIIRPLPDLEFFEPYNYQY